MDEKVDCQSHNCSDGSRHLVFTVRGSDKCVGEVRITADDRYLLVIAQLVQQWAGIQRNRPPSLIQSIHALTH